MTMQPYGPQPPQGPYGYGPPQRVVPTSGMAVASLILGLLGLSGVCCWPLVILSVIGVVCGHLALGETRSGVKAGNGLAVAGLIVSYLTVLPTVVLIIMAAMGAGISAFDSGVAP